MAMRPKQPKPGDTLKVTMNGSTFIRLQRYAKGFDLLDEAIVRLLNEVDAKRSK